MEKRDNTPMWVFFAFSSIETRIGAMRLIWASVVFTLYCLPWPLFLSTQDLFIDKILIEDWSWFAMMVPVIIWYWLSLRWMDTHAGWDVSVLEPV